MPPKAERLPASSFSEPSEPSEIKPEDKPKEQITHEQEENPQVIAKRKVDPSPDRVTGKPRGKGKERTGEEKVSQAYEKMKETGYVGEPESEPRKGVKGKL